MVELRKRKDPPPGTQAVPPLKKSNSVKSSSSKKEAPPKSNAASAKVNVGDTINLDAFGGEVETNEGVKTSLKKLVEDSKAGVVLFTYPKASTPGCEVYPILPSCMTLHMIPTIKCCTMKCFVNN